MCRPSDSESDDSLPPATYHGVTTYRDSSPPVPLSLAASHLDQRNVSLTPPPPVKAKQRGRPRKVKEPSPPIELRRFSVMFFVDVLFMPVEEQFVGRGRRPPAPSTKTYGPATLTHETTWESFLDSIAALIHITVTRDMLVLPSMSWQWHGSRGGKLPVVNRDGFSALVQQIRKDNGAKLVQVYMAEPKKQDQDLPVCRAWKFVSPMVLLTVICSLGL